MIGTFAGFEWDGGNWPKCGKHGVSIAEIEFMFQSRPAVVPDVTHSRAENRFLAIGRTREGRYVFVCFTIREQDGARRLRPISARYMHAKEVKSYEESHP